AEQAIMRGFDIFVGGPADFDKLSAGLRALAIREIRNRFYANKDNADARPLLWVTDILKPYYETMVQQGKAIFDGSDLRRDLMNKGLDTPDAIIQGRLEGRISHRSFIDALTWLGTLESVEKALGEMAPAPTGAAASRSGKKKTTTEERKP